MEFIEGKSFDSLLEDRSKLSLTELLRIASMIFVPSRKRCLK